MRGLQGALRLIPRLSGFAVSSVVFVPVTIVVASPVSIMIPVSLFDLVFWPVVVVVGFARAIGLSLVSCWSDR